MFYDVNSQAFVSFLRTSGNSKCVGRVLIVRDLTAALRGTGCLSVALRGRQSRSATTFCSAEECVALTLVL